MNNKNTLALVELCLTYGQGIKIAPEGVRPVARVSFKYVAMAGIKLVPFEIHSDITQYDIEFVRDIITQITAGESLVSIEKQIADYVPF